MMSSSSDEDENATDTDSDYNIYNDKTVKKKKRVKRKRKARTTAVRQGYPTKRSAVQMNESNQPASEPSPQATALSVQQQQQQHSSSSSVPPELAIIGSSSPRGRTGVYANSRVDSGVRFGPYRGLKIAEEDLMEEMNDNSCMWEVKCGESTYYVDGHDDSNTSWLKNVRFAQNKMEQNLVAFQHRRNIYYLTIKPIEPGNELLVWYDEQYIKEVDTGDGTNNFKCKGCSTAFISWSVFDSHLKCSKSCSSTFITPYFSCKECDEKFPTLYQYHVHLRAHRDDSCKKTERVKCETCGKLYSGLVGLKIHQKRMHSKVKPYKCSDCGKAFVDRSGLTQHAKIHNTDRNLKCHICSRTFAYRELLNCHLRYTHSDTRNYQCYICGDRFKAANHCTHHILHSHTEEERAKTHN